MCLGSGGGPGEDGGEADPGQPKAGQGRHGSRRLRENEEGNTDREENNSSKVTYTDLFVCIEDVQTQQRSRVIKVLFLLQAFHFVGTLSDVWSKLILWRVKKIY